MRLSVMPLLRYSVLESLPSCMNGSTASEVMTLADVTKRYAIPATPSATAATSAPRTSTRRLGDASGEDLSMTERARPSCGRV